MKNMIIWGVVAGAAAATIVALILKKDEADELLNSAKGIGNRLIKYGNRLKDNLLNNAKGPNGEDLYIDMYDRQFYEDPAGKRIYLTD
ncbi:hypothetical protein ADIARSV_1599 [Arcticibacter svalbardensis MN12-7]|uniref:Uncharacterized protein n=1 Tax=Arcticibacter svalbardensis MN12-7 TaxID=1150600 RepID=R9GTT1_9SPHI|nr:hypothetical protein [Arcticibacter svalbardensis]EOR95111.1 hypothetical protein ADIARSV_1599 [Arcticibacter svalbardensis MN12-7]